MNYAELSWCERHGARHTKGQPCPQCVQEDADGTTERLRRAEANLAINPPTRPSDKTQRDIWRRWAKEGAPPGVEFVKLAVTTLVDDVEMLMARASQLMAERDEARAARTTALEQTGKFAALAAELREKLDLAEAHAGRMVSALVQCRNLTRMQEQSPGTVREVGERVAEIVTSAIVAPAAEVALKERVELNAELRRVVDLMAEQRAQLTEAKSKAHDLANEVQGLRGRLAHVTEALEGWKP